MTDTPTPPGWAAVPRTTVRWSLARVDGDTTDVAVGDRVTLQPTSGGIAVVDPLEANPVSIILESRTYKVRADGALVDDQGDMAAVLAVDDPRVATPGGRVVQWIARHEKYHGVIRFPAAAGETVELSRWVAATAPEPTQRSWAEQLVDAAEDVTAGLAAAVEAGGDAVAAAGQAAGSAASAADSAAAATTARDTATAAAASATAAAQTATQDAAQAVGETFPPLVERYLTANPPPAGDDGREVELQTSATHVQWRYSGDATWTDLIPLTLISGTDGDDADQVELQSSATHIQWRRVGDAWADLIPLVSLKGPKGDPARPRYVALVPVSSERTITEADEGALLEVDSATPVTVTLPDQFPLGGVIDIIQTGDGSVTLAASIPPLCSGQPVTRTKGSTVTCVKRSSGWAVIGDVVV